MFDQRFFCYRGCLVLRWHPAVMVYNVIKSRSHYAVVSTLRFFTQYKGLTPYKPTVLLHVENLPLSSHVHVQW